MQMIQNFVFIAPVFAISLMVVPRSASSQVSGVAKAADPSPTADAIKPLVYDVITIKPDKSASGSMDIGSHGDRFSAQNVLLKELLAETYGIKEDQISGIPPALDSVRFDILATISDYDPTIAKQMTAEQQRQMLLPLLVERFQLKAHIEIKTLPV